MLNSRSKVTAFAHRVETLSIRHDGIISSEFRVSRSEDGATVHQLLIESQSSLYAFIVSLLGTGEDAWDVLQETNFAILSKAGEFDSNRSFMTWACRFAQLQVLAFRKRQGRDRVRFDDELVDALAQSLAERGGLAQTRLDALARCVEKLPEPQREALSQHYEHGFTYNRIAKSINKTPGAVAVFMCRIRKRLFDCVQRSIAAEAVS